MNDFNSIAVWQTAFLGDAVLTLPLIQTLARSYPHSPIDLYVRRGMKSLLSPHPDIHSVIEFDKRGSGKGIAGIRRFAHRLRKQKYDLLISAHTSFRSGLISFLSKIPHRIGYQNPWYNRFFYTTPVDREFYRAEEIERLLKLLQPLSIDTYDDWPRLALDPSAEEKARNYWNTNIHSKTLGIHPGSVWQTKRWPVEHFSRVARSAIKDGVQVLVFGGPGEEDIAQDLIRNVKRGQDSTILDVSGSLSLPELAAFLGRLDCYLTNDSGPMHMAWCQNVPVVALFGPTIRELGFFPRGDQSVVLEENLDCRPCGLHGARRCPHGHHLCMKKILPETAFKAIKNILKM